MKSRQIALTLEPEKAIATVGVAKKISEILRAIAQELDNKGISEVDVPSQIGPFFEINGKRLCLYIIDQSRVAAARVSNNLLSTLSRRQHEILMELVEGRSAKTIAERLGIHLRTVEAHIHRIYQKTGTHGIAQLMEVFFAQL